VMVCLSHVVERRVGETATQATVGGGVPSGERFVEEVRVGEQVYRPWEEAVEREIVIGGSEGDRPLHMGDLIERCGRAEIDVPEGNTEELLIDPAGTVAGVLGRAWRSLRGAVGIAAEARVQDP